MARNIIKINKDWEFSLGDNFENGSELVCVPHCVKLTPAISSGCLDYQGKYTYKKNILISTENEDKNIFLSFEGVMGITEFFINGELVKKHYSGYIPCVMDITSLVKFGEENEILLISDNTPDPNYPLGKEEDELDFTYEAGLYRDVELIITDKLHITNSLVENVVAGGGVFFWSEEVTENFAIANVKTHVRNCCEQEKEFSVCMTLSFGGEVVAKNSTVCKLSAGGDIHVTLHTDVLNPMLWSPDCPNLYTLDVEIEADGEKIDNTTISVGIRNFEFTPKNGTIINGKSYRLSGANYHQTYPYIGNAVPYSLLYKDMKYLHEAGMTSLRSHYPFGRAITDACNELGITLIVSNPGWQFFGNETFEAQAVQNMREIIRWQRNNPCIFIWEPYMNESPMSDTYKDSAYECVHEEFPYAECYVGADYGKMDISYKEFDPLMLSPTAENYEGVGTKDGGALLWVREYNDCPDNWTDQNCSWRSPRGFGEYAMLRAVDRMIGKDPQCQGHNYIDMYNNKKLCGFGTWPGIEHNRGYHINPCWGGYLDLFRNRKFSFYFMQSQQEIEKAGVVLHIANLWSEISPNDITVLSNADSIRLYHDDVFVGEQIPEKIAVSHPPFIFKDVRDKYKVRERSVLKAEAIVGGEVVKTQTVQAPGVAWQLKLSVQSDGFDFVADGADIVRVSCDVLDREGNIVPYTADMHPIIFEIEGEGEIIGDSTIGANPVVPQLGTCNILVKSTKTAGEITVKADLLWKNKNFKRAVKEDKIIFCSV